MLQSNCSLNFADSEFDLQIPNHVSGETINATLRAVRSSDSAQRCVPGFSNVTRTIQWGHQYQNPSTGSLRTVVNGVTLESAPSWSNLSLAFNANGEAPIALSYADVGAVRLLLRYLGSSTTNDIGLTMLGQDDFIARPDRLEVVAVGNPAATAISGPVYRRAG